MRPLLQVADDVQSIQPRHVDINQCDVNFAAGDDVNRLLSVARFGNPKTATHQALAHNLTECGIIVSHEKIGYQHRHHRANQAAPRTPLSPGQANHDYHDSCNCDAVDPLTLTAPLMSPPAGNPAGPPVPKKEPNSPRRPAEKQKAAPVEAEITSAQGVSELAKRIIGNVEHAIVGKRKQLVLSLVTWLSGGHILLEDVPGVAKTMLARALARSVGCKFKRVQCTPDLLPTDVTGTSIFNQKTTQFEFRPGPVFTQILLADEINRATPRTQASLLEAMAESRVTVDGTTHTLESPFVVIATQNPVDHEGTFPLPEAQLDRFMMRFALGYPSMEEELRMLEMLQHSHPIDRLKPVAKASEIVQAQAAIRKVHVDQRVRQYLLQIVSETRSHNDLALGGSPRATIALFRCSQAMAAIRGREFVLPDDIKKIIAPIMNHRLIVRPESRLRKVTADKVIDEIVGEIAVPTIEAS
jgi:MoxR-like ATPase